MSLAGGLIYLCVFLHFFFVAIVSIKTSQCTANIGDHLAMAPKKRPAAASKVAPKARKQKKDKGDKEEFLHKMMGALMVKYLMKPMWQQYLYQASLHLKTRTKTRMSQQILQEMRLIRAQQV